MRIIKYLGFAIVMVLESTPVTAQMSLADGSVVIGNDRGGYVRDRLIELRNLRASGQTVRITGEICYSTCTMLIGLPQACISPNTTFGFHGPSLNGRPMEKAAFDHTSRVIAHYYPEPLKAWYLAEARNTLHGVHRIAGADLIRMGVKAC